MAFIGLQLPALVHSVQATRAATALTALLFVLGRSRQAIAAGNLKASITFVSRLGFRV